MPDTPPEHIVFNAGRLQPADARLSGQKKGARTGVR